MIAQIATVRSAGLQLEVSRQASLLDDRALMHFPKIQARPAIWSAKLAGVRPISTGSANKQPRREESQLRLDRSGSHALPPPDAMPTTPSDGTSKWLRQVVA